MNDFLKECQEWAVEIKKDYSPDIIVYIAKAGYLVARPMKTVFNCHVVGIDSMRKGNGFKSLIGPLVARLPRFIRDIYVGIEVKSRVHYVHSDRKVSFHESIETVETEEIKKIMILDDSVDTGNSMMSVYNAVKELFKDAEIRCASLNVWKRSLKRIRIDYYRYTDTIIKAPTSKDSREYKDFVSIYGKETRNGYL